MQQTCAIFVWPLLLLAAMSSGVSAAGAKDRADAAAAQVLAAHREGNAEAIRKLAGRDDPDPWLVADALLAAGETDAAAEFAGAAPRKAVERLSAYVAVAGKTATDPKVRSVLEKARLDLTGRRTEAVLAALAETPPACSGIQLCLHHHLRAVSLWRLKRSRDAAAAAFAAAEVAKRIGWLRMEAPNRQLCALNCRREDPEGADRAFVRCLAIHRALRSDVVGVALQNLAAHRRDLDPDDAVALYGQAIDWYVERKQPGRAAGALGDLGLFLRRRRDFDGALASFTRARRLALEAGDKALAAGMRINYGTAAKSAGDIPTAIRAFEEGAKEAEAAGRADWAWNGHHNVWETFKERGEARRGLAAALRLVEIANSFGRPGMLYRAHTKLGISYKELGEFALARDQFEKTMPHAAGPEELYRAHVNLGGALWAAGRLDEALAALNRAGEEAGKAGSEVFGARVLVETAALLHEMGDPSAARERLERARAVPAAREDPATAWKLHRTEADLAAAAGESDAAVTAGRRAVETAKGQGDLWRLAHSHWRLGGFLVRTGELAAAMSHLESAREAVRPLKAPHLKASILASLTHLYSVLDDEDRALACARMRLELCEEGDDPIATAGARSDLAVRHLARAEPEAALALFETAYAAVKDTDHEYESNILANLGRAHEALRHPERAMACFRQCLLIRERRRDRGGIARARSHLAGALDAARQHEAARAMALTGLEDALAAGDQRTEILLRHFLSRHHEVRGENREALEHVRAGIALVGHQARGLAETEAARYRERREELYSTGILAGRSLGEPETVYEMVEARRAGTLLETLREKAGPARDLVPDGLLSQDARAREAEQRATARLKAAMDSGDLKESRLLRKEVRAARERVAEVDARFQRAAKSDVDLAPVPIPSSAEVRKLLRPDEALVLYSFAFQRSLAVVLTKEETRLVQLEKRPVVQTAARRLAWAGPDPGAHAAAFRQAALAPLGLDAKTKRLIVSPTLDYSYVPWALVAEGYDVALAPSATAFAMMRRGSGAISPGSGVLALADPAYPRRNPAAPEADVPASLRSGFDLAPLPNSREEAEKIADVALLGKAATEEGLAASLKGRPRWRALHLAGHGLIDAERPLLSAIALTPGPDSDGFLRSMEVLRMEVPADLVVLSACETARGQVFRSEGIVGLTRAFMIAGAPRVLCSLWKVDDEATKALMVRFYELWNPGKGAGLPAATALREAQEHVRSRKRWSHPRFWAAWVLWGLPE